MKFIKIYFSIFVLLLASMLTPSYAQFRMEVSGVGLSQLPIAVTSFRSEDQSPQKISEIVKADLERTGQFLLANTSGLLADESSRPDFSVWRQKNTDALASGSISRLSDGRYDVRVRLWDTVKGQDLGGKSFIVVAADMRLAAHQVSDFIYEKLTGEKGVFATRISYVTKNAGRHSLWVADSDGQGAAVLLSSQEPIISPSWSPKGNQLVYVSFELRKPVVFTQMVQISQRKAVANFKGSNSAPAWSPDGRNIVVTLSRDGGSQLYLIDSEGRGDARRLTQSNGIDTEAVYSANGQSIYFVSDRGGSPQIYRMPASGGNAERVTFNGSYNISPAPSPDGRFLAYISKIGASYKLHVLDLSSGAVSAITNTWSDERPSFSPNSKLILFASKQDGREVLMTTTVDGKVKTKLASPGGDIREPSWGPKIY